MDQLDNEDEIDKGTKPTLCPFSILLEQGFEGSDRLF